MTSNIVWLSIGSNLGDRVGSVNRALQAISAISGVKLLKISQLYETSPVSDIPQGNFINAACKLRTTLDAEELFFELCRIEKQLGKGPKDKNAPREIDIDLLFFGTRYYRTKHLEIPHPRWNQRLFVLVPLQELTRTISWPINSEGTLQKASLKTLISALESQGNQRVQLLETAP